MFKHAKKAHILIEQIMKKAFSYKGVQSVALLTRKVAKATDQLNII